MAAREAELLPIPYFHVVFTLPSAVGDIAYHSVAASDETDQCDTNNARAPA
jgi:hypothetical protein